MNNKKIEKKGRKDLVKIIRDNKISLLDARFNLNPKIQSKTSTRKNLRKDTARVATALSKLAKEEKIVDSVNTNKK